MTGQVQSLTVEGFRSVRGLDVRFENVNLITGPNGCGKSNLFNAFRLLKAAVEGRLGEAIAEQGGMQSILWAGPRQEGPVRMKLTVASDPFEYSVELGLRPASEQPLFPLDPQIKHEVIKLGGAVMVDRKSSAARMKSLNTEGELRTDLVDSESVFSQVRDPEKYSYLYLFREIVERWAFYHDFRTDPASPIRQPALATYPRRLKEDGSNLAPTLFLAFARGEAERLREILSATFPGTTVYAEEGNLSLEVEGINRPMSPKELSDGTLKFLCLAAACFSVHSPPLIAFNEPENSLSPAAIEPLADMLAFAAQHSQLWITTHSAPLTKALVNRLACRPIRLDKREGETVLDGRAMRHGYQAEE